MSKPAAFRTPIAIVGVACRLPGADDVDGFWRLLSEGRSAITEMPPHRLDREMYYDARRGEHGKTYSSIGGLVSETQPETGDESFDVCHRIFADVALGAVRNAGLERDALAGRPVGVFVGHSGGSPTFGDVTLATMAAQLYEPLRHLAAVRALGLERANALVASAVAALRKGKPRRDAQGNPHSESRWAAELVARTLGLTGPNLVLDAACSSSLVAMALGALALERGEVDVAIAGGASYAQTNSLILFSQAQSCSATGSSPFDATADGLVASEGYVAMVLKTEAQARRDGDTILGVIRGIGLSTDGRGRHLWAPRKEGQTAAMQRAYASTIDPGGIQYVEAHATSTQVGDATEIESMAEFFGPHLKGTRIPIGSVKSNIGHTLETAGLSSLLKVVLAMRHGVIPPTVNINTLNRTIDWTSVPFDVVRSARAWERPEGDVRRAAVSAFGIGGLNVHLIVEEPTDPAPVADVPSPSHEPIAIVGRGVVLPGARDVPGFAAFLKQGTTAVGDAPESRWPPGIGVSDAAEPWTAPTNRGGYVRDYVYDSVRHRVPPKQMAAANPLQFMLLDAAEQALHEAGTVDHPNTAVVVGTAFGGEFGHQLLAGLRFPEIRQCLDLALAETGVDEASRHTIREAYEQAFGEAFPAANDVTGSFTSSTLASRITKAFDLEGGALAIDAGDASSFSALATACNLLRGNACAAVVCAGAQRALDLPSFEAAALRRSLRPPDDLPGEGVGAVVLKRLSDARRDGNTILGILFGEALSYHASDLATAARTSVQRAVQAAGLEPGQVIALESGTVARRAASDHGWSGVLPAGEERAPVLSSLIGHLGPAEGVVSIIRSTLQPAAGVEGVQSLSGSGLAGHVLLGPAPAPVPRTARRVTLGAPSRARLREKLLYGVGTSGSFGPEDRFRFAAVASHPGELPARLALAESLGDAPGARALLEDQGVFFGEVAPVRPRVAFIFPGQGSQYPGMLRDLVEYSPAARRAMEEADRHLSAAGLGSFAELAWREGASLDADPVTTQVAVLVADMIMFAAITESGIEPDCVAGHSFGEIPAMVAARVFTLEQAIRVTLERARALGSANPDGGLLSIQASVEDVRSLVAGQSRELFITHSNAPEQTVVGGLQPDLLAFAALLRARGIASTPLRVPGALHSPLVAAAQPALRAALERESLRPPTRLFYSNVSRAQVSQPREFVENLVAQIAEPLEYPALIARLREDGVGALVEVGPSQVLTRLHRQIVGTAVVCVGTDHRQRGGWEQLERVHAALECIGAVEPRDREPAPLRAAAGTVVEFDATTARRQKRRAEAAAAPAVQAQQEVETPAAATGPSDGDSAIARLLLDFVVDLTGYPREAISLDWDLEADLGLDSIKRTQLVGEVGEALAVTSIASDAATLARLRTLRELLGYFQRASSTGGEATAPASPVATESRPPAHPRYDAGFQLGHRHAATVRAHLKREALEGAAHESVRTAAEARATLTGPELEELRGLADGSGVHIGNLVAYRLRHGCNPTEMSTAPSSPEAAPSPPAAAGEHAAPRSRRYVMRMASLPLPGNFAGRRITGTALVVGDDPVARRLRERLAADGVVVHAITPGGSSRDAADELERLWAAGPIPHLFISLGRDADAVRTLDAAQWARRRERILMMPFAVCQRWITLVKRDDLFDDATLVGLTALGGDFGFAGQPESFESGVLPGLFKAISIEAWVAGYRHLPVKLVDAASHESAEAVVDAALRELAIPSYEAETAISHGVRRVVRPVQQDLRTPAAPVAIGGRWVCTGGARGITAYVSRELALRFNLELHLVGRITRIELRDQWRAMWTTQRRELKLLVMEEARARGGNAVKAWERAQKNLELEETLDALKALGVDATYHSCDISDQAALERVLADVRARGPIDGILHGAGASRDAKFEQKDPARVDQCFRAKVDGTLALMDATQHDPIKHFVAFGSVSGRFGANGHADYSAANDMMAKLVDWYRGKRPEVASVTFHWHAWGDVGMATKAETQLGLQMVDMEFMPAVEGVDHLIRELQAGAPEAEVLITQERYFARFYSEEASAAAVDGVVRPLLDHAPAAELGDMREFACTLDPEKDAFLVDHRLDGRPLLPFVVGLELAAEAALDVPNAPFTVQPVTITNGLRFPDGRKQVVRVRTATGGAGAVTCDVVSDFHARDGTLLQADRPILHASFTRLDPASLELPHLNGNAPRGPWQKLVYNSGGRFHHGPAFQSLRRFSLTEDGLWGTVVAPAVVEVGGMSRPAVGWRVHPAVLDACFYATACLAWSRRQVHSIPAGIDRLTVGRFPLPREDCLVHVVAREQTEESGCFDFRLYGADGTTLIDAQGYRIARLAAPAMTMAATSGATE